MSILSTAISFISKLISFFSYIISVIFESLLFLIVDQCTSNYSVIYNYWTPFFPWFVISKDMNHDNRPDIILSYGSSNKFEYNFDIGYIDILFNNGDGTFNVKNIINFNTSMTCSMVVADINGDGELDIITFIMDPWHVKLLLKNSDDSFNEETLFFTEPITQDMKVADLNGDNKSDIILLNVFLRSIIIMFHTENGILTERMNYDFECLHMFIEVTDLDNDATSDVIITCSAENKIMLLVKDDNNTYTGKILKSVERFPIMLVAMDINDDEKVDLVVFYSDPTSIGIHLNIDNGEFDEPTFYSMNLDPMSIIVGDINNDKKVDILVKHMYSIGFLFQTINSTFTNEIFYSNEPADCLYAMNDFDGNDQLDIIRVTFEHIGMYWMNCN